MNLEQYLIFEITDKCNLSIAHADKCPAALDRFSGLCTAQPLTDDIIVTMTIHAYNELNFTGLVGWHYYCEPLLEWPRIQQLMKKIQHEVPKARFVLWTNGVLLPSPQDDLTSFKMFQQIWVSNYLLADLAWLQRELPSVDVHIIEPSLDSRTTLRCESQFERCLRPYAELIIDYFGNCHLCCMDYRAESAIGNVWTDGFDTVARRFLQIRNDLSTRPPRCLPVVCQRCAFRVDYICDLVEEIASKTHMHLELS